MMDDVTSMVDMDDLVMDLEDPEGSELDDDEGELTDDQVQSPFIAPSPGPGSTATSNASSPNTEDVGSHLAYAHKIMKRGRGRPRREGGKVLVRRSTVGGRVKRVRSTGYPRSAMKRWKSLDKTDYDFFTSSPIDELTSLDPESSAYIFAEKEKHMQMFEELPYSPEQWPGKVCAFCNLSERSQLGQGEMLRLNCPEGFVPERITSESIETPSKEEKEAQDRNPKGPVTCRRQKSYNKCRQPSLTSEYIDELTIIGYAEEPDISLLFENSGHFYVHRNCTMWSKGVIRNGEYGLENVGPSIVESSSRKCSFCNHFGASLCCRADGCNKVYHYPCCTASGAFQDLKSMVVFCQNHLGQATIRCESSVCYTCKLLGDISNLMYCSSCGEHYHGICVGLAQLPGVRAGWQCRKCRICQVCRMIGDETKLMSCEQCDKVYHATCQRPIVTSIPKYGWKCRCCRICGDCGSRTPGAGLSSRWHAHYTVCDSCYQQRNKGFFCPLCHRAYRAHAHREMVLCSMCHKYVHGTCDPDADVVTYHQKKESCPEYEYVCPICKNQNNLDRQLVAKRPSTEDQSDTLSVSQESLNDDIFEFDLPVEGGMRNVGLGKGKPYSASRFAKKRLGLTAPSSRPKGTSASMAGKGSTMKRQKINEFYRKRGSKTKMRGLFGVPGVGLQRPLPDGKNEDEPGVENRLVLCSAKDKYVLTQDICVMCGALGTDQEGCLISCAQCGQCYHPYCVNVKVTKVILENGWRCLDCTVCEGCGQRNDESRLILCDECDISYHIYCMDPPLEIVPQGNWKCKWCAVCQSCGTTDPGFNCNWMNSFTECGPCTSFSTCPSCYEHYREGELVIQCMQCERWLHGSCDSITNEDDAEKCAELGYYCILCRPRDEPPPHLAQPPPAECKPPTPTKSPENKPHANYLVDGVCLSEAGHNLMQSLCSEYNVTRKKRKKVPVIQDKEDKEAGIMATIESVVAGVVDMNVKDEPQELFKEGMIWTKEDGTVPDGFTIFTMENGMSVLRKKRQRNLQKLGIGGFLVRVRGIKGSQESGEMEMIAGTSENQVSSAESEKPRKKPLRRKIRSKLSDSFPSYIQEAFFGKDLLDSITDFDSNKSDDDSLSAKTKATQSEMKPPSTSDKNTNMFMTKKENPYSLSKDNAISSINIGMSNFPLSNQKIEKCEDNTDDDFKDVLGLSSGFVDNELVDTIMNERDQKLLKRQDSEAISTDSNLTNDPSLLSDALDPTSKVKDELCDVLGPNFNLDSISNINSKDVDDIFKGVLTDESQESQDSGLLPDPQMSLLSSAVMRSIQSSTQNSYVSAPTPSVFPPQSPRHSDYSNNFHSSPQFSPNFSEPPSPWITATEPPELDLTTGVTSTYNQRSSEKMRADESLGNGATISAVLYANMNHPEWKSSYSNWSDRYKQIIKKWRSLSSNDKAPYLQQARDNRSALRMKKQQQFQDKTPSQVKSAKESEQEKQWKRLQQLRHQQALQHQALNEELDESTFLLKSPPKFVMN